MLPPKSHPIWKTIDNSVMLAGLLFFLWLNASTFDKTEMVTVLELLVLFGGWQGATSMIQDGDSK